MKNILLGIVIFLLVFLLGCGEKIDSNWKDTNLIIDGVCEDWADIPLYYNEDMKVMYGVVNDDSVLQVMVRFNNPQLARMFSMRGATIWFNDENEKENKLGIHYVDRSFQRPVFPREERRPIDPTHEVDSQSRPFLPKGRFTLAKNDSLTEIALEKIKGMKAAVDYKDGLYCYEFSMALIQETDLSYYLNVSGDKIIKIGFEISPVSEEEREKMREEMAERRGMRMPGGRAGMRGGRPGGGMRGPRQGIPDMDGAGFWVTVVLASS